MRIFLVAKLRPLIYSPSSSANSTVFVRFRCSVVATEHSPVMEAKILMQTQRYAARALFALALHQTQIHQTRPFNALVSLDEEPVGDCASVGRTASVSDDPGLWIHESSGLLYPVLRFLGVDDQSWKGLKETSGSSSQVRHHVGAFLTLLKEEGGAVPSSEMTDKEAALTKTVDTMVRSEESVDEDIKDQSDEYEYDAKNRKVFSENETKIAYEVSAKHFEVPKRTTSDVSTEVKIPTESSSLDGPVEEGMGFSYEKKITVLYALLSACVADNSECGDKYSQVRNSYDARHRVALRLLATWLGIEWLKVEVMETMVACSFMASLKEVDNEEKPKTVDEVNKENDDKSWEEWKCGGLIGAAALTGGTLMAITGGLVAPAVAQGLGALTPILALFLQLEQLASPRQLLPRGLLLVLLLLLHHLEGLKWLEELAILKSLSSKQLKGLITKDG